MTTLGTLGEAVADRGSGTPAGERKRGLLLGSGEMNLVRGDGREMDDVEDEGEAVVRVRDGVRAVGRAYLCVEDLRIATLRNLSNGEGCIA